MLNYLASFLRDAYGKYDCVGSVRAVSGIIKTLTMRLKEDPKDVGNPQGSWAPPSRVWVPSAAKPRCAPCSHRTCAFCTYKGVPVKVNKAPETELRATLLRPQTSWCGIICGDKTQYKNAKRKAI